MADLLKTSLTKSQRRKFLAMMGDFVASARSPRFRTMAQFGLEEIWLPPGGPRQNERLSFKAQPWVKLWLDEVDSDRYVRHVLVAMVQGGKTFAGWVLPAMYYLFERGENVGLGLPQMEMARDKWERDLLPVIMASKYRDLIPDLGKGSKGGDFDAIKFKNGAWLKFISAKGDDAKRSGITFKILIMTEVDKYDEAGGASRETSPVNQMMARLESHPMRNTRIFMECTASFITGKIWTEFLSGTQSRIVLECPHCRTWNTLEREHLRGWQTAANEVEAFENAHVVCPACEKAWTEAQRKEANSRAKLVHRGQEVTPDGQIVGSPPPTYTLGFRCNVFNNCLKPIGDIAYKEFKAKHSPDEKECNEKALVQFQFAKPWGGEVDHEGITPEIVASRLTGLPKWVCPEDTETLVVQIDLHQKWHVWTLMATGPNNVRSYLAYDISLNPDPKVFGPEHAIRRGLERLADDLEYRQYMTDEGRIIPLDLVLIDGGYYQSVALEVVTARGGLYRLVKGQGKDDKQLKLADNKYKKPEKATKDLRPSDHWFDSRQSPVEESDKKFWWMVISDTNHWMHKLHDGFYKPSWLTDEHGILQVDQFGKPIRRPDSCALFGDSPDEHLRNLDEGITKSNFATQVCGWVFKSVKTTKKGEQIGWQPQWASHDHFGDTGYGCLVADSVVRRYAKRFKPKPVVEATQFEETRPKMPDGRPYLLTER